MVVSNECSGGGDMDESWRMRIGKPSSDHLLDFSDVFGGPPRTRHFSSVFPRSSAYFYHQIFRHPDTAAPPRTGRTLPEFRIPGHHNDGFYSDIFDERLVRSRSRSKASSSSVLSSEELSPLRPPDALRPINVRARWNSTRMGNEDEQNTFSDYLRSYPFGRNASPETISLEPLSNGSFRVSADDTELNNSPVSSVCHEEEDDDVMSSYVIEINSDNREGTCESNAVDEAIAWAKEKSQTHHSECEAEKTPQDVSSGHQVSEGHTDSFGSLDNQQVKWEIVEDQQLECTVQTETEILDEKIRLWSSGKDADIRLLLSSLHHILWPNSGWLPVPLANIIESSQVKKSYQKARLCLHPDKLQQRGATPQQKYVADKAFSVLQDAWAAFITLDVF